MGKLSTRMQQCADCGALAAFAVQWYAETIGPIPN